MHTWTSDYDLVLEDTDIPGLELAVQLLKDAGIPAMIDNHLSIQGFAGEAGSMQPARVFVARGAGPRAREVLAQFRGQAGELERSVAAGEVPGAPVVEPRRRPSVATLAFLFSLLALLTYAVVRAMVPA